MSKKVIKFTPQQKTVIAERNRNVIVSASAGSGKTSTMIERIVSLIEKDKADIERMVICTFTNSASDEMRYKLMSRLIEKSNDSHVAEQIKKMSVAQISTLHKWCSNLIKTYFYECDTDPYFEIIDDNERDLLLGGVIDEVITETLYKYDRAFYKLYEVFRSNRGHVPFTNAIKKIYEYAFVQPDPYGWLDNAKRNSFENEKGVRALTEIQHANIDRIIQVALRLRENCVSKGYATDVANLDKLLDSAKNYEKAEFVVASGKDVDFDVHEQIKKIKSDYNEIAKSKIDASQFLDVSLTDDSVKILVDVVVEVSKKFADKKEKLGVADYNDLEHRALKLLHSKSADEVRSRYDYVFIDEYQDINPLQEEILRQFNCKMFFIGDVKQSIYGFRLCEPRFIIDKCDAYKQGAGLKVDFTKNFRSDGRILQFVDSVFSRIMTREFGGTDYANEKFNDYDEILSNKPIHVSIFKQNTEKEYAEPQIYSVANHSLIKKNDCVLDEIKAIATHIVDVCATQNAKFADIAILVRSRNAFTTALIEYLRSQDIPATFTGEPPRGRMIELLYAYLKLIDNYNDDISLSAVMLSDAIGDFSETELKDIRDKFKTESFFDAVKRYSQLPCGLKVKRFLSEYEEFRKKKSVLSAHALAGEITARYRLFAFAMRDFGLDEAEALDGYLAFMADSHYDEDVSEWVQFIAKTTTPKIEVQANETDSVKIMTIHASKGLEFPYVILPNLDKNFSKRDVYDKLLLSRDDGIALKVFDVQSGESHETLKYAYVSSETNKRLLEEEMRVLYVALTRAKIRLSLFATERKNYVPTDATCANSFYDWLYPDILPLCEQADNFTLTPPKKTVIAKPDDDLCNEILRRATFKIERSDKPYKTTVTKQSVTEDETTSQIFLTEDDRGAKIGDAYHKFMKLVNLYGDFDAQYQKLKGIADIEKLTKVEELRKAVQIVSKTFSGYTIYKEQPFVLTEGQTLTQGVIDLIAVKGEQAVVIDYKTTRVDKLINSAYEKQMDLYCKAVETVLGKKVIGRKLYSFSQASFFDI